MAPGLHSSKPDCEPRETTPLQRQPRQRNNGNIGSDSARLSGFLPDLQKILRNLRGAPGEGMPRRFAATGGGDSGWATRGVVEGRRAAGGAPSVLRRGSERASRPIHRIFSPLSPRCVGESSRRESAFVLARFEPARDGNREGLSQRPSQRLTPSSAARSSVLPCRMLRAAKKAPIATTTRHEKTGTARNPRTKQPSNRASG